VGGRGVTAAARWNFNGEAVSGGEEMGRRNGESGKRNNDADSFYRGRGGVIGAAGVCGGGGGGGARSGFRRKKTVGLTDRMGPPVNERRPKMDKCSDGSTGLDREGGGGPRLGWKIREEAGPKPFLGLKSNRVKENQF
jgi:hypothetical protein